MELPYVIASEPTNLSSGVRRDITVEVWFNHDLDRTTVTSSTVLLFDLASRKVVCGTVVYAERKICFTPDQPLSPGAHYQFVVLGGDSGVKDVFGVPLAQSYKLEFTTSAEPDTTPPTILEPAEQSVVSDSFII
ncbi:MAG: Ig-like domain-containing protein, partial [Clostridia bacterium]|nr:Ig-like domain-containing protein [Clostridia bacterium]